MNEDVFNVSVRKFLKKVGITSQREIEQAVRRVSERDGLDFSHGHGLAQRRVINFLEDFLSPLVYQPSTPSTIWHHLTCYRHPHTSFRFTKPIVGYLL